MSQIKIKDFLIQKLNNFKLFMNDELNKVIVNNNHVTPMHIDALNKQLDFYIENINVFISFASMIDNKDTDFTIKMFLDKHGFNIDEFKDDIDYDRLKRYINMFNDVIKNNLN